MAEERLKKCAFEELFPVEYLSSMFRFCLDLKDECEHVFKKEDSKLVCDVLEYQLNMTESALKGVGYVFIYTNFDMDVIVNPRRAIILFQCDIRTGNPNYKGELIECVEPGSTLGQTKEQSGEYK